MLKKFVVGKCGYTEKPIAVFDTDGDAYEFAKCIWPTVSEGDIFDRIHEVLYIESTQSRADAILKAFDLGMESED